MICERLLKDIKRQDIGIGKVVNQKERYSTL